MKYIFIIIAFVFVLSACNKDEEQIKSQGNKTNNIAVNGGNNLKGSEFGEVTKEEVIEAVKSFQQNRKSFWESGSSSNDYTQKQALFEMPLVLNFELAGYGYLSEIETRDITINITNNGPNENGETVLNGNDMFRKYKEVEDYIKTELGDKKLYFVNFNIIETTETETIFNVHISYATLSESIPNEPVHSEFPVIPINTIPSGNVYGHPQYLADWFTAVFNPIPQMAYYIYRTAGKILVPLNYAAIHPDPMYPSTHFLYHNSAPSPDYSYYYKIPYYNWINAKRLAAPSGIFATSILIAYVDMGGGVTGTWEDFRCNHIIYVNFAKWEYTPELFNDDLPIIEE